MVNYHCHHWFVQQMIRTHQTRQDDKPFPSNSATNKTDIHLISEEIIIYSLTPKNGASETYVEQKSNN